MKAVLTPETIECFGVFLDCEGLKCLFQSERTQKQILVWGLGGSRIPKISTRSRRQYTNYRNHRKYSWFLDLGEKA